MVSVNWVPTVCVPGLVIENADAGFPLTVKELEVPVRLGPVALAVSVVV